MMEAVLGIGTCQLNDDDDDDDDALTFCLSSFLTSIAACVCVCVCVCGSEGHEKR
jgi:hypothetical protein